MTVVVDNKDVKVSTNSDDNSKIKVCDLIAFDISNRAVKNKTKTEWKTYRFCKRRISINIKRLDFQKSFRQNNIIDQKGNIQILSDSEYWLRINLVGFTDIVIPRYGADLLNDFSFLSFNYLDRNYS